VPNKSLAYEVPAKLRRPRLAAADGRVALGLVSSALFQPYRPLMANLVVTRRCNLACGYCHEYDHTSSAVPLETLRERIDHLARLRTVIVTLTGGETLLHPDIAAVVAHVRERGMTPAMNTNGLLLSAERIRALGRAGLTRAARIERCCRPEGPFGLECETSFKFTAGSAVDDGAGRGQARTVVPKEEQSTTRDGTRIARRPDRAASARQGSRRRQWLKLSLRN
jgi:hypothetical protein